MNTIKFNNGIATDPTEIATIFNIHFTDNSNNPVNNNNVQNNSAKNVQNPNSMFLMPMSREDIQKEIMSMKNINSEGYDGINTKIIKASVN